MSQYDIIPALWKSRGITMTNRLFFHQGWFALTAHFWQVMVAKSVPSKQTVPSERRVYYTHVQAVAYFTCPVSWEFILRIK